jgi:hypothetical protein
MLYFGSAPPSSRQASGHGLNEFSNGEYQSPQQSQPDISSPGAKTARLVLLWQQQKREKAGKC